jgi:hypothetical protein
MAHTAPVQVPAALCVRLSSRKWGEDVERLRQPAPHLLCSHAAPHGAK